MGKVVDLIETQLPTFKIRILLVHPKSIIPWFRGDCVCEALHIVPDIF